MRGTGAARAALLIGAALLWPYRSVDAQTRGDVFRNVNSSVVVIRAKGRDVDAGGLVRFNETGSGVIVSVSHNISKSGGSEGPGFVVTINT